MKRYIAAQIEKRSKTVGVRNELDRISRVALIYQQIFGQQILEPEWTWRKYFIHQLLSLILFIYVFLGTLKCLQTTNDSELVAEASYTMIMIVVFPIKMLLFISNRFIFRKLYINAKTTLIEAIQDDSTVNVVNIFKNAKKIVMILFLNVLIPISIYEMTTFWYYIHGKRPLLSRSTSTLMPMVTPYYELAWFLHSIFIFEIASTVTLDMWFILLVYFLCSASDSLANKLAISIKTDSESNASYARRLNDTLRRFYKSHTKQVIYMSALRNMYKWLAFVPLCNAAMCICLIFLLMSKEINWRFAPHMLPMLAEIFAYNWFGEQIKTKMEKLHQALINYDWVNMDLRGQKNYYIILTYMKKEFGIKTAVGSELSLITMTTQHFLLAETDLIINLLIAVIRRGRHPRKDAIIPLGTQN